MITPLARRLILGCLIAGASICLYLGVTTPVMKLSKLYVWTDEHSIVSIVMALMEKDEFFLSWILIAFSIIFPAMKLLYLTAAAIIPEFDIDAKSALFKRMEWLGKWSMLDVLVLALTIFYVKSSGIADASSLPGIYYFTAAVVLTMFAYSWVKKPATPLEYQSELLREETDELEREFPDTPPTPDSAGHPADQT